MIVRGRRAELFVNADQVVRVVDSGEDGVQIFYIGDPHSAGFNNNTFHDDTFIPAFLNQLQADDRFTPLGNGRNGPSEYVNFNNVRRVILENGTATVWFLDEQRSYQGRDYEEIARRVSRIR